MPPRDDFGFEPTGIGSVLEQLELPFIVFDSQFVPVILSSSGARLLEIGPDENLRQHLDRLKPLRVFAERWFGPGAKAQTGSFRHRLEEVSLETATGRSLTALAFSRTGHTEDEDTDRVVHVQFGEETPAVVLFQDLTYFQPFFSTIEQSRRNRSLVVLVSSFLGKRIDLGSGAAAFKNYLQAEEMLRETIPLAATVAAGSDFLKELSVAVDIVDPLILPTSKVLIAARSSALLAIPKEVLLRLLSHLLLEASDFGGPFGKTTVSGTLVSARDKPPLGEYVIEIIGERKDELPVEATPLEVYLYRRYVPSQYRVALSEELDSDEELSSADSGRVRKGTHSISRELYSENLLIAGELAGRFGSTLYATRPTPNRLELRLAFTLMAPRVL